MIWLYCAAAMMAMTALAHSIIGERRLIGPMLAINDPIMAIPLARTILRFAWHLTSLLMLMTALMTIWPATPHALVLINGALWLGVGLFDAIATKGQHVGWPLLSLAGLFAIVGASA
jgi:hypothetical protein